MIAKELLSPKSIVVVGASNDIKKPGGKILWNIINGGFGGDLYAVNPKEDIVQGITCKTTVEELPNVDLAILAIPAQFSLDTIKTLTSQKGTKGFIILSAGFSEVGDEGRKLEEEIVKTIEEVNGSLIGPNCIGVLTTNYRGVFAGLTPKLSTTGVDFVSASGATACFILEVAVPAGLQFNSIFSVGNSAQIGVEEVLEFWDESFDPEISSKTKMIYIENIDKPLKLLKHASSLINKGCRIAAVKAGRTDAGNRAVSSHTGALAGSDAAIEALFKKAGIVRCFSRQELAYVVGCMQYKPLEGKNIAVITHAGGPGVMLTDELSDQGLDVPHIQGEKADELKSKLYFGSAVGNPIDFLATGTAEQLGTILDYVDNDFDNIDGSVVIFGTPGIFDVTPVYDVLNDKINTCKKPIFPCLPSVVLAHDAVEHFKSLGRYNLEDEVQLGKALGKIYHTPKPAAEPELPKINENKIRLIIESALDGYLPPNRVGDLLDAAGIPRAIEKTAVTLDEAVKAAEKIGFPMVMKVVGPIHKTDVGGVVLNVKTLDTVKAEYERMMKITDAVGVLLQPMLSGQELFAGAKAEPDYGHLILYGLGGIFIEVFKDVACSLAPVGKDEVLREISKLRSAKMFEGVRSLEGINKDMFADVVVRLSALLKIAPEIAELDLNPLLGTANSVVAVDARILIEHPKEDNYFVDDYYIHQAHDL
jgi:acetyltransferase